MVVQDGIETCGFPKGQGSYPKGAWTYMVCTWALVTLQGPPSGPGIYIYICMYIYIYVYT